MSLAENFLLKDILIKFRKKFKCQQYNLNELLSKNENSFLYDLKVLSFYLNASKNESIDWNLIKEFDLIKILVRLFSIFLDKLNENLDDDEEFVGDSFKNLLEIINKISMHSIRFVEDFYMNGLFTLFLSYFQNRSIVQFLFDAYVIIFIKFLNVFCQICKYRAYFDSIKILSESELTILIKTRDLLEVISRNDERFKVIKPAYHLYLIGLSFLQTGYKLNYTLVSLAHSDEFKNGYIKSTFKNSIIDFRSICELVEVECVNEQNKLEIATTHKLKDSIVKDKTIYTYETFWSLSPFLRILECIRLRSTSDEMKQISYYQHRYFFKSIVYFGLDIKKILCLRCLNEFCKASDSIKLDFFHDTNLKNILKMSLASDDNHEENSLKMRLKTIVENFQI